MEYKIIFEEVVQHEFYVTADSPDDIQGEFELAASQSEFDFSAGDVVMSQIVRITDESGKTTKFGDSYADLEEKCLNLESEDKQSTGTWNRTETLCPEEDETVIVSLKDGKRKAAYYQADEDGDIWIDVNSRFWGDFQEEISPDQIEKWGYINDICKEA